MKSKKKTQKKNRKVQKYIFLKKVKNRGMFSATRKKIFFRGMFSVTTQKSEKQGHVFCNSKKNIF
jgi:hypothetical protein